MGSELARIVEAAGRGVFPAADGGVTVVGPDGGRDGARDGARDAGVIAFTAHSVVFTAEDPAWVRAQLAAADCDPLAAAMNPRFLAALLERSGRRTDTVDVLSVAAPLGGPPPVALREIEDPGHPRVVRALGRRDGVRVWAADGGLLVLGRGVGGRWEAAVEVEEAARHRGLGRALAAAARHLVAGPVWAQVAAGNARSLRAFQAAGFRPVGAESLHALPHHPGRCVTQVTSSP